MTKCLGKDLSSEEQRKDVNPDDLALENIFSHHAYYCTYKQEKKKNQNSCIISIVWYWHLVHCLIKKQTKKCDA